MSSILKSISHDCRVPALMKVTIAPMAYRMIVVKQMLVDVIHCLTLFFYVCHKIAFIISSPVHYSILGL